MFMWHKRNHQSEFGGPSTSTCQRFHLLSDLLQVGVWIYFASLYGCPQRESQKDVAAPGGNQRFGVVSDK